MNPDQTAAPTDQPIPDAVAATTYRRAAALAAHTIAGDGLGTAAVMAECADDPEHGVDAMIGALVRLWVEMLPGLATPEGVAYLRRLASSFAADEGVAA